MAKPGSLQTKLRSPRKDFAATSRHAAQLEHLESRWLFSGGNYLDSIVFGNATSEAAHNFDTGLSTPPPSGTGAMGLTYREIAGPASGTSTGANNEVLTFTITVDPFKHNYLTIRLWGSDTTPGLIYLYDPTKGYNADSYDENSVTWIDWQVSGGQPAFPGRFYYDTTPIPLSWTQGQTSISLTLNAAENDERYDNHTTVQLLSGQTTRPIYDAYTTTDPDFTPDSGDPTGTAPASTSTTLTTLTAAQAQTILLNERKSIYGTNGYYNAVTARQVLPAATGAPGEVVGLDLFATPSTYNGDAASVWDAEIGDAKQGPGYTGLPDELLSLLSISYLLPKLSGDTTDPNYYHNSTVLQHVIYALDGSTYEQGSDGGFPANGSGWVGLTAAGGQRIPAGSGGYLEGIDCQVLGDTLLSLLNDPALPGGMNIKTYLGESYDANLDGGSMLRAYAYERMLFNNMNYLRGDPGGTSSQNLFQVVGAYADQIALETLQALYPNGAYPALPASVGLNMAQQVMGTAPTSFRGGYNSHFALSPEGLGKDGNNNLEGSYDRGYGEWFPELALQMAKLVAEDPGVTTTVQKAAVTAIQTEARNTVTTYDEFLSTNLWATTNGSTTTYSQIISPDDTISNRNENNAGSVSFDVDTEFASSNPNNTSLYTSDAARSAYLEAENGQTPELFFDNQTQNSNLQYLREVPDYEASINALVNNTPAPLPNESSSTNFAWADVVGGVVAFQDNGERVYMSLNYRGPMGGVDNIVRIHDTTATSDRIADIYMPSSGATEQSDGNLSGGFAQAWVARYGKYLVVLNRSSQSDTVSLPAGSGNATDLLTGNTYAMGGSFSVPAGQAAIIYLGSAAVAKAAALQPSAPFSGTITTLLAGYPTATLSNNQSLTLTTAAFDSNGLPVTTLPAITWTLQSGIGSINSLGTYTAPQTGAGTVTIVASTAGVTSSPITLTVVPLANNGEDIGTVGIAGSDSYASGTYTVAGAGAGLTGTADAFHFVSQPITGDATLTGSTTSGSATAGVMFRGSTSSSAAFAAAVYVPSQGVQLVYRLAAGGTVAKSAFIAASTGVYLQIARSAGPDGTTYTGAYSTNGTSWTNIAASQTIATTAIAAQAFAGVLVTSGSTTATGTATFSSVAFTRPAAEFPTISSLTTGVHGTNVWYQFNVTDAANSGNPTLAVTDQVVQDPANASPYSFQGTNFYPTFAGTYVVAVRATNGDGLSVTQNVTLNVTQVLNAVSYTPATPIVLEGSTQTLFAVGTDQFGDAMAVSSPTWTIATGGGSISSGGVYTASTAPGAYAITVKSGTITGTSDAEVIPTWLSPSSQATWNASTHVLNVTGPTAIIADPGSDEPTIEAAVAGAYIVLDPASGTDIHIGGLSLTNGASAIETSLGSSRSATNYHVLAVGVPSATAAPTYTIDSTSTLDLTDNDMAILYGSGSSPLTAVEGQLEQAYDGGPWNKPGLTSSIAATEGGNTALGFGEASTLGLSTFDGLTLDGNAVLVKYTVVGDTNLDGSVSLADYNAVLANYNASGQPWTSGSVDYSGSVGLADYNTILANYNQTLANFLPATNTPAVISGLTSISTATTASSTVAATPAKEATTKPAHPKPVATHRKLT
jgi:hypothetical protein